MADIIRMLVIMAATYVDALAAGATAGLWAMLTVLFAGGWAMAQYDHNYKRVRA